MCVPECMPVTTQHVLSEHMCSCLPTHEHTSPHTQSCASKGVLKHGIIETTIVAGASCAGCMPAGVAGMRLLFCSRHGTMLQSAWLLRAAACHIQHCLQKLVEFPFVCRHPSLGGQNQVVALLCFALGIAGLVHLTALLEQPTSLVTSLKDVVVKSGLQSRGHLMCCKLAGA